MNIVLNNLQKDSHVLLSSPTCQMNRIDADQKYVSDFTERLILKQGHQFAAFSLMLLH
jgi:hypothetical protein